MTQTTNAMEIHRIILEKDEIVLKGLMDFIALGWILVGKMEAWTLQEGIQFNFKKLNFKLNFNFSIVNSAFPASSAVLLSLSRPQEL